MTGPSRPLELLESTPTGVRLYPLVERVRGYHEQGFASKMAFRRLSCPRPAEALSRLLAFARQAEGKVMMRFSLQQQGGGEGGQGGGRGDLVLYGRAGEKTRGGVS